MIVYISKSQLVAYIFKLAEKSYLNMGGIYLSVCQDSVFCQDFISMQNEGKKIRSLEVWEACSSNLKSMCAR